MRSILDSPRRYRPPTDAADRLPVARRYVLQPSSAVIACAGLRATVLLAAQAALVVGGAGCEAVIAELARTLHDLAAWWRDGDGLLMERPAAMRKGTLT